MRIRHRKVRIGVATWGIAAMLGLVLTLATVTALPSLAQQPGTITPTYVGTSTSPSAVIVLNYLQTLDINAFNQNAELTSPLQAQPVLGRDAIGAQLSGFFNGTFTGSQLEVTHAYFLDSTVIVEFILRATNTGPFLEFPPTNLQVNLPMIGVFELENGLIQRLRLYFDFRTINEQLGLNITPTPLPPAVPTLTSTPFSTPGLEQPLTQEPTEAMTEEPTGEATEPVGTEEPPVMTEEPPVMTEEPPVMTEEPPVMTEEPPPPVMTEEPPPPVMTEEPPPPPPDGTEAVSS